MIISMKMNSLRLRKDYGKTIINIKNMIYLDVFGIDRHLDSIYGYSLIKIHDIKEVPGNNGWNVSLIYVIDITGVIGFEIIKRYLNGNRLINYIKDKLISKLKINH